MTHGKENVPPPGTEHLPEPVRRRVGEIINQIMTAGRWRNVTSSTVIPQENNMWELRVHFNDGMTRRVRIGGNGAVFSDTTAPTRTLN